MSTTRKTIRAKRTIPETFKDNNNVQIYLAQYKLTDIPNPSDDSDFEDTTYEDDLLYEKRKQDRLKEKSKEEEKKNKRRERQAKKFYNTHKNNVTSIFTLPGIHFEYFDHKYISFVFSPRVFDPKFIVATRKYSISLKYKESWWSFHKINAPIKKHIINYFCDEYITDDNLSYSIYKIYQSLVTYTQDLINLRKEKYQRYLNKEDVDLNSDEEKLFLTTEERKNKKMKRIEIWNRMLPP